MEKIIEVIDNKMDWSSLADLADWTVKQAITIQQIPAPTFAELQRAKYIAKQFKTLGLDQVEVDDCYNVYGFLKGMNDGAGIMVSAHTDTVFGAEVDLQTQISKDYIYGPGLGDNSMGVAGLLGCLQWMQTHAIQPETDIWFVATSGEEGLGNLGGMRVAYERLNDDIRAVINLEGLALGHIYYAGIAVRRLQITAKAEGGHSWLHYGRASAIHGIVELGARITSIVPPSSPRTTYNIGLIDGGHSINSIATYASLWLDMRSEARETLMVLEEQVREQVSSLTATALTFEIEVVGDRPSGKISRDHPLVQGALTTLKLMGIQGVLEIGSTDGNIPLSEGCPTITIGITRGGNAHRLDEYIEIEPVGIGLRQLIVMVLATSQQNIKL